MFVGSNLARVGSARLINQGIGIRTIDEVEYLAHPDCIEDIRFAESADYLFLWRKIIRC